MKAGWKTVKLGERFKIRSSKRVLQSEWKTEGVPFYRGREVTILSKSGVVDNELFISEGHFKELSAKYGVPAAGDIILTAIGTIGNAYVVKPNDRFYFKDASVLWITACAEYDSNFVNYWIKSDHFKGQLDSGNGATVDTLTLDKLKSIEIPLPPPAEQKRIVALLDEAFAGIDEVKAKAEASIQSLGTLVVSEFQSLIDDKGFERKLLPELASHTLGKMLDKKKNTGTPRPYLRNVNVRWFEFDLSDIHEMPIRDEEAARCQARKGDVLMCEGGYPGRCAIWCSDEPVFFQKALHRIRFNDKWMAEWFVNYMHSLDSSGKISEFFTGTGIQHLTGETLSKLKIPVPPKSEIEAYVKKISAIRDKTNELAASESAKVNALCELKASLLTQAFAGELTA